MYIDKATISKYTSYFHDGSLIAIEYGKNEGELILTMESAEVHSEDIKDNEVLLAISWRNYPPKAETNDFSTITIDVRDVCWENLPDLES